MKLFMKTMRANFEIYTKEEIADAFREYMAYVLSCEGTTCVEFEEDYTYMSDSETSRKIVKSIWEKLGE
jgi:hypothetical protein